MKLDIFINKEFLNLENIEIEFDCNESTKKAFDLLLRSNKSQARDCKINIIIDSLLDKSDNVKFYFLTDDNIEYMINNQMALVDLAHMPLDSKWLLKIYNIDQRNVEALQTVSLRLLQDTSVDSVAEFYKLIDNYRNSFIYFYIIYRAMLMNEMHDIVYKKLMLLFNYINDNFHCKDKLYKRVKKYKRLFAEIYNEQKQLPTKYVEKELTYGIRNFY